MKWDAMADELDLSPAGRVDAVVHLAGANVAGKRWNAEYKAVIRDSRVRGTRLIAKAIAALDPKSVCQHQHVGVEILADDIL